MIDPNDPDYTEKRAEELIDQAINRLAAEADLPIEVLHRALLDKAHDLMLAIVELETEK